MSVSVQTSGTGEISLTDLEHRQHKVQQFFLDQMKLEPVDTNRVYINYLVR